MVSPVATSEQWLHAFEATARARDFAGGGAIFAAEVA
jgi:hypothetical protein